MKIKFAGIILLLAAFLASAQDEYRIRGRARVVRRHSWKNTAPKRQLRDDIILTPSSVAGAVSSGRDRISRRRAKAEEAAYGKVKPEEYSPAEKALLDSLEKVHKAQLIMHKAAGTDPVKAEKALQYLRRELKILQPALYKVKDFPCRLILDNPKEIIRESRRLFPKPARSSLQRLQEMQSKQKQLLQTHLENKIRARRSFR